MQADDGWLALALVLAVTCVRACAACAGRVRRSEPSEWDGADTAAKAATVSRPHCTALPIRLRFDLDFDSIGTVWLDHDTDGLVHAPAVGCGSQCHAASSARSAEILRVTAIPSVPSRVAVGALLSLSVPVVRTTGLPRSSARIGVSVSCPALSAYPPPRTPRFEWRTSSGELRGRAGALRSLAAVMDVPNKRADRRLSVPGRLFNAHSHTTGSGE